MALVVDLRVTTGHGTDRIQLLEVRRLTGLHSRNPDDEVHRYVAQPFVDDQPSGRGREFEHRYGDGAWVCVARALHALGIDPGTEAG